MTFDRSYPTVGRAPAWGRADVVGLFLVTGLAGWIVLSAALSDGSRVGPIGTVAAAALAFFLARLIARRWARAIPLGVVLVLVVLGAWAWTDLFDRDPLGGPLGYQNANAALFVQAFVASLLLVATTSGGKRIVAATVTTLLAASLIVIGSTASIALAAGVGAAGTIALVAHRRVGLTAVIVAGLLLSLVATIALGAMYTPRSGDPVGGSFARSSTEMRLALWHDALALIDEHPIVGIGPGRFAEESRVAASDPDTRHTHHEFLQIAAETGVIGGVLLAALFVWAIARTGLGLSPAGGIAAAGVAALGIHSCVDYVLHFPLVPIASAVLVGAASFHAPARSTRKDTDALSSRDD